MQGMSAVVLRRTILLAMLAQALAGCAAAVVGGGAVAAHDRRTVGTVFDDQNAEYRVIDQVYSSPEIGEESHIKVEVYEGVVLLMGETDNEARRELAGRLAGEVDHIERVVNEIQIEESATLGDRVNNTWLTAKVNTALVRENPMPGFDATRIKVISSNHTVYLMGLVTREEGDAVAEVTRNVSGVERVVKVFNYFERPARAD